MDLGSRSINVLSLFDGMSCGQIALKELGVNVNNYYASEIDKHAIKLTQHNFPNTIQLGDVTKWKQWDIDWSSIDLIMGGSPCQGFSFAGKQLAFDDPRSKLFFVFHEIRDVILQSNPSAMFLLENVKMKKEYEAVISQYMGIPPIQINSALVSAQNRVRLYWTNIANEPYGLFGDMQCMIPQPKDKGVLLRDILETDVPDKYYLSEKIIKGFIKHTENSKNKGSGFAWSPTTGTKKANCITSRCHKMGVDDNYIITHNTQTRNGKGKGGKGHLSKTDQKSYCLDTGNGQAIEFLNERQKANHKNENEKANTFLSTSWKGSQANGMTLVGATKIRRLTTIECKRLQTVPHWYDMSIVSDTQQYRALGNGWTIDVIKHILSHANFLI
jgi:site-specific DNA-cytosine methylase